MKDWRMVVAGVVVLATLGIGAVAATRHRRSAVVTSHGAPDVRAPDGARIRVQVLNSTKTRGLARRATLLLRDRGFDVVEIGTVNGVQDSTVVLDLSGHPEWASRVAKILGSARVEPRADSSRYLDIAVVLGSTWHPPAKPFYP
jgi:hypothetical protein